jgi:2-polyprenyl-6-hydroxyphenyl methylase/3-demethylubiquinone-9 3-methyltransferase
MSDGRAIPSIPHPAVEQHEELAHDWERKYKKRSFAARERLVASCMVDLPLEGKQWLDAGCGTGRLSRLLAKRGCRVRSVDAAKAMLDIAEDIARAEGLQESLAFEQVQTIETLPFGDAAFDGILCSSVIEYLDNVERCLAEFARTLRPEGWLLLTVPNRLSLIRRTACFIHRISRAIGRPWPRFLDVSKNEYDSESIRELLARHAFRTVRVEFFGGPLGTRVQRWPSFGTLILLLARKQGR